MPSNVPEGRIDLLYCYFYFLDWPILPAASQVCLGHSAEEGSECQVHPSESADNAESCYDQVSGQDS